MSFFDFLGAALQQGVQTHSALDRDAYQRKMEEQLRQDRVNQLQWEHQHAAQQEDLQRQQMLFNKALAQRQMLQGGDQVDPALVQQLKQQGLASGITDQSQFQMPTNGPTGEDIQPGFEVNRSARETLQDQQVAEMQRRTQAEGEVRTALQANPNMNAQDRDALYRQKGVEAPKATAADEERLQNVRLAAEMRIAQLHDATIRAVNDTSKRPPSQFEVEKAINETAKDVYELQRDKLTGRFPPGSTSINDIRNQVAQWYTTYLTQPQLPEMAPQASHDQLPGMMTNHPSTQPQGPVPPAAPMSGGPKIRSITQVQ